MNRIKLIKKTTAKTTKTDSPKPPAASEENFRKQLAVDEIETWIADWRCRKQAESRLATDQLGKLKLIN